MSQTSAIAGSIILAFIVFITVRSELPCYLGVLGISSGAGGKCPSPKIGSTSTSSTSSSGAGGSPVFQLNFSPDSGGGGWYVIDPLGFSDF